MSGNSCMIVRQPTQSTLHLLPYNILLQILNKDMVANKNLIDATLPPLGIGSYLAIIKNA